jgi:hypothetical protein
MIVAKRHAAHGGASMVSAPMNADSLQRKDAKRKEFQPRMNPDLPRWAGARPMNACERLFADDFRGFPHLSGRGILASVAPI